LEEKQNNEIQTKYIENNREEKMKRRDYTWVQGYYKELKNGRVVRVRGHWRKVKRSERPSYSSPTYSTYISPSGSRVIELILPKKRKKKKR